MTTLDSSGKRRDGTTGEIHRPGKIMLKSVAGGITLLGSLFLLLHLRYDSMLMRRLGIKMYARLNLIFLNIFFVKMSSYFKAGEREIKRKIVQQLCHYKLKKQAWRVPHKRK